MPPAVVVTVVLLVVTMVVLGWWAAHSPARRRDHALVDAALPVLAELQKLTGLDSAFVTRIDWDHASQRIVCARNGRDLQLPEGLAVDWPDNLSAKVVLGSGPGEASSFRSLGVGTSLHVPILTAEGRLFGTLGAASATPHAVPEHALVAARRWARELARSVAA